jgi:FkbM family methyltransferase
MFLRSINCVWLLFFTTHLLQPVALTGNAHAFQDLKTMVGEVIPLRRDGKIEIPKHIKHIKLDIGLSYCAPMSRYWLSHENDLLVFGFEPNPASVTSILQGHKHGVEKKDIGKNFFLIPCALGLSSTTMIKFFVTANDCGCSSIYFPRDFPIERIIEVPIFSLSAFFDLFPFDSHPVIDYIKIDTQGSDLDIAKSAGHYLAERVIYITLEAENGQYEGTVNSQNDIDVYMRSIGFIPHRSPYTSDPTYFNSRYSDYVKHHNVQIYQKG